MNTRPYVNFLAATYAFIAGTLAAGMPSAAAEAPATIKLARLAEFPDQIVGGEILKAVYARLGITVEFVDAAPKRALALSSSGEVDGEVQRIGGLEKTFPTLVPVRVPINDIEPAAFTTGLTFSPSGWNSITDHHIGIVQGVGSSEAGTKGMAHVQAAVSLESLIRMLDAGRIDVMVTDAFSGQLAVASMGLAGRIRPLSPPLDTIPLYHYLNERRSDLVPLVEKAARDMEASGELARLRADLRQRMIDTARQGR